MRTAPLPRLALLALLTACGDGDSPTAPPRGTPGIEFPVGTNVTDTIGAAPVQAMRVRVIGADGRPAASVLVRVDPPIAASEPWGSTYEVLVAPLGATGFWPAANDTTDADGIVHFQVRLGERAGAGRLVVTAPALGMRDTARFTILPGAAAAVRSFPADTAVMIGNHATIRAGSYDRSGNLRPDAVAFQGSGTGAAFNGGTVTGTAFGRAMVVASAGGRSDTSYVSVVPQGVIAAYSSPAHTGQAATLYTFNLDGSEMTTVRQTVVGAGYFGEMPVAWLDATRLIYHDNNWNHTRQLYVHDLASGTNERFLAPHDQMEMENYPRLGQARDWVYFGGGTYWARGIYRARPDGSAIERVTPETLNALESSVAPSPDGTELALVDNDGYGSGTLRVMNLATRETRNLGIGATAAKWSPDGTAIAYLAEGGGALHLIAPDGSDARRLSGTGYTENVDWSPDGRYIVGTTGDGRIAVIEVATRRELILDYPGLGRALRAPVWRP